VSRATTFATLGKDHGGPEGITHDAKRSRFLIGNTSEIWQVDKDGKAAPFVQPKDGSLLAVLGLKVDEKRDLLWAVNTIFPDFPPSQEPRPDIGVAAVNVYDLETGALKARHLLDERPTIHGFNDLALAANGDAYVTDSSAGAIYKIDRKKGLALFLKDADITLPNGLVLSEDARILYVAHVEGISAIDLRSKKRTLIRLTDRMAVGSIDGLARAGRSLIGVQSSPYLQRVIRIDLDKTGLAATDLTVLNARSHPRLWQATGVVVGDEVYVTGLTSVAWLPDAGQQPDDFPMILRIPLSD
jgi:sugar lactone lactonase YvrE